MSNGFMGGASVVLLLADLFERVLRVLRGRLDTRSYQKVVFNLVEDTALESGLPKSEQLAILRRLENAGSDPLLQELCACKGRPCFEGVLRRLGFSSDSVSLEMTSKLVDRLTSVVFTKSAKPHHLILLENQHQGHRVLEQVSADVEFIRDHLNLSPLRPVDPEVGNTAVLARQVSFPLLVGWSPRLNWALEPYRSIERHHDPLQEYRELIAAARAGNEAGRGDLQVEFENVAVLCVEREFSLALSRLQTLRHRIPAAPPERQVLYYRLKGAIHRSLGGRVNAKKAYEQSLALLKSTEVGGNGLSQSARSWLERQLEFDLLSLDAQNPLSWRTLEERSKLVRSIPAWHRHPAVDAATGSFVECLAREWIEADRATESTWRMSSLSTEAICHFNRALALCYLSGDFQSAREVRLQFAASLAPHHTGGGADLLGLAALELLATNSPKEVEAFLAKHDRSVADLGLWDEVAVRYLGILDEEAYDDDTGRTTLAVIERMAPYLSELTVKRLNDDFWERSMRYLGGGSEPLIRGRTYRENSFIQAYSRIFRPSPAQLLEFVDALAGHSPAEPFSLWEVLAGHKWRVEDADSAQRVVDYAVGGEGGLEGKPPVILLQILGDIIGVIPALRARVAEWLVRLALMDARTYGPFLLFTGRHEEADLHARGWVDEFTQGMIDRLVKSSSKGVVAIGGPMWQAAALPVAVQAYAEHFSQPTLVGYAEQLLGAVESPDIPAVDKADVYRAVLGLVSLLEGEALDAIRVRVSALMPLEVQTKLVDLKGPWYSPSSDEASLALLRLRETLDLEASSGDVLLVAKALRTPSNTRAFAAACDVAEEIIEKGGFPVPAKGLFFDAVYGKVASGSDNLDRTARALRFLVRTANYSVEPLTTLVHDELSKILDAGHPYLLQTVFHEAGASWDSLSASLRQQLVDGATSGRNHAHRQVRYWANELLQP